MARISSDSLASVAPAQGAWTEILDRNVATTAACVTGCATVGLGALVFTTVTPGAAAVGIGLTAGLAYVGHRDHKGLSLNPFSKEASMTGIIDMANRNSESIDDSSEVKQQAEPELATA